MTREEAAKYLRVHVRTLDRWMREGKLPHYRIAGIRTIRIKLSDLEALLTPAEPETDNAA